MPLSSDLTTELSAVNTLLAAQGEQPVESLEAITSSLTETALNALREASRSLQTVGWYWNTEDNWEMARNADMEIPLPANTLKVTEVRNSGEDDCIQRGQRLYSRTRHTYKFPDMDSVKVTLVVLLGWEELPEVPRQAIMYVAQRRFQMRELTSTAIDRAIADDTDAAIAQLHRFEDESGPANILDDNPMNAPIRGRARRRY
jgi:hypothetical protein